MSTTLNKSLPRVREKQKARGIVFGLSQADLRHEWILTACLVMAIAAVLSPLLLLFGLKYGTIETLRFRLVQDPRNREIRPLISRSFSHEWFAQISQRPDVGFVIPMTRQIAATVTATVQGKPGKTDLDIVPTGADDPLILENGAPIPEAGECVLTHFAAEELQAQIGDTIIATARRIKDGQYESGDVELKVIGILSLRASELKAIYVQLPVLEAVERFKDGQAVPEFGWPGSTPTAYPQYQGLIVIVPQPLNRIEQYNLRNNTGFTQIEELTPAELSSRAQFSLATNQPIYFLSTERKPVGEESVETVRRKLRGKNAMLLPWIAPITAWLRTEGGTEIASLQLYGLSIDPDQAQQLQMSPRPDWGVEEIRRQVMLPSSLPETKEPLFLQIDNERKEVLTFPVSPVTERTAFSTVAFVPIKLGGMIALHQQRNIHYDRDLDAFVLSRRGYAGFRLYVKTIEAVDGLRRSFENQSIPVHTEAQRIEDVLNLDRYLTLIFWLIALVGVLGGVTALLASLYASVERKKRELSVLRLIGLSGPALFRYPIYQGILIGIGGFLVALLFFQAIGMTINTLFREHLGPGESFCRLPLWHTIGALAVTIGIAILAATFAAWRVTHIEPAEALRDE